MTIRWHLLRPIEKFMERETFCGLIRGVHAFCYTDVTLSVDCEVCLSQLKEHQDMNKPKELHPKDQLKELGAISPETIIKVVEDWFPAESSQRHRMSAIADVERRKDAKPESARNLAYWLDEYKNHRVEIPKRGVDGIMTDAKYVCGTNGTVSIVIDGEVHIVDGDHTCYFWPKRDGVAFGIKGMKWGDPNPLQSLRTAYQAPKQEFEPCLYFGPLPCEKDAGHKGFCVYERVDGVLCRVDASGNCLIPISPVLSVIEKNQLKNEIPNYLTAPGNEGGYVLTTAKTLFDNKEQYEGFRVDIETVADGIFYDMWTMPGNPGWYIVVVDRRMHSVRSEGAVAIHMPAAPKGKAFTTMEARELFSVAAQHYGKVVKSVPGDPEWSGTFTHIIQRNHVYGLVIDGKVRNIPFHKKLLVEL